MATFCLDISTAPLHNAGEFILPGHPPSNYKNADAITNWQAADVAEKLAKAALDPDLCRITGIHIHGESVYSGICVSEEAERLGISILSSYFIKNHTAITYNGRGFDIPVLKRRARYLGVKFPDISTDKYKSPVIDLMTLLSDHDPQRRRSLDFYVKRLGWTDLDPKPLSGAEEARVFETGQWDLLAQSLQRDVTAIHRLASWLGVL